MIALTIHFYSSEECMKFFFIFLNSILFAKFGDITSFIAKYVFWLWYVFSAKCRKYFVKYCQIIGCYHLLGFVIPIATSRNDALIKVIWACNLPQWSSVNQKWRDTKLSQKRLNRFLYKTSFTRSDPRNDMAFSQTWAQPTSLLISENDKMSNLVKIQTYFR